MEETKSGGRDKVRWKRQGQMEVKVKWKGGNTHEFRNRSMGSGKAKFATIVRER